MMIPFGLRLYLQLGILHLFHIILMVLSKTGGAVNYKLTDVMKSF